MKGIANQRQEASANRSKAAIRLYSVQASATEPKAAIRIHPVHIQTKSNLGRFPN